MENVIFDCDNTLGVKRSDIDDGLTFAYLHAHENINVLGITCTFANNHEPVVFYNTRQMLEDMHITDVPVLKGGRGPQYYESEAVDFLVKKVNEMPGEISVIATGSMNNIAGAHSKDPLFYEKVKQVIIMGGMLEPLWLNDSLCKELNFTVDPISAADVVFDCPKLTLMSSQCTKMAEFFPQDIEKLFHIDSDYIRYIKPLVEEWVDYISPYYGGKHSFINWDLCCALYLTNPELFDKRYVRVFKDFKAMRTGFITLDEEKKCNDGEINIVNVPSRILDLKKFNELFYHELKRVII